MSVNLPCWKACMPLGRELWSLYTQFWLFPHSGLPQREIPKDFKLVSFMGRKCFQFARTPTSVALARSYSSKNTWWVKVTYTKKQKKGGGNKVCYYTRLLWVEHRVRHCTMSYTCTINKHVLHLLYSFLGSSRDSPGATSHLFDSWFHLAPLATFTEVWQCRELSVALANNTHSGFSYCFPLHEPFQW